VRRAIVSDQRRKTALCRHSQTEGGEVARPVPLRVTRSAAEIGENLAAWRKLQSITSAQLAERAGISRSTLSKIEHGDPGVGLGSVLAVSRALGVLDALVEASDPYRTDLGRARADEALPIRVRP
jgi:DNA-binding XRE family transcriptional regulator